MYKDEIKKIEYYKDILMNRYLKDGEVLNSNDIQKKIDEIDTKLAVFQQGYIVNGETLDIEKLNSQKQDIYTDLKILYELMYETARNRLSKIHNKIKYNINYLKEVAKKYRQRAAIESIGVFGKTVYYKTNGFEQYYDNGSVFVDLGDLQIDSGSYVACFIDSEEFTGDEEIVFNFDNKYKVGNYMDTRNLLVFNGNYQINKYNTSIQENTTTEFEVSPTENFVPLDTAKYNLFVKKNHITIESMTSNIIKYLEKNTDIAYEAEEDCNIDFYVYGASYINIEMNDLYETKSFENSNIVTPKVKQKIHIKANKNFIFDIDTDGEIYAAKTSCFIKNKKLYTSDSYGSNEEEHMLEEIEYGDPVIIKDALVEIKNKNNTFYDISYIMIKSTQTELDGKDL